MTKIDQPVILLPQKSNTKKNNVKIMHADHILTIKGVGEKSTKYRNVVSSSVTEHFVTGIIHSTMEGLKSNMKLNLPIITDVQEYDEDGEISGEEIEPPDISGIEPLTTQITVKTEFSYLNDSREIIDLSPIYENSSDAGSSHDDLNDTNLKNTERLLNSNNNRSSTTPLSQSTQNNEASSFMNKNKQPYIDSDITRTKERKYGLGDLKYDFNNSIKMAGTFDVINSNKLDMMEAGIRARENEVNNRCTLTNGAHIFTFTLLCLPFIAIISFIYTFFLATHTWVNIFIHVTKNKCVLKKVLLLLIVIFSYPVLILFNVGLSLYSAITQISFSLNNWEKEVSDYDKGFFGWVCNKLGVSDCCPYKLSEIQF